jgi:ankyrin repeat protein
MAADKGDMKMITLLCKYKCLIDPLDKEKMTPLYYAIRQSNIEMCKFFLENGANLEHREIQERTPFYWAASLGEMSVTLYLVFNL